MNRRDFSLAASSFGLLSIVDSAYAQGASPVAGKEYLVLAKPAPVDVPVGKIEVAEFFSYNCPHCAAFEPRLEAWVKKLPTNVVFKRVPVPFVGTDVEVKQRFYYTLEAMGKVDEFQFKIFQAIHNERQRLVGEEAVLAWSEKQPGLDAKKFADLFKSFAVSGKAKRATQVVEGYKVSGVPSFGIAGRFYSDGELAGTLDRALEVTDFLIGQARKA